MRYNRCGRSGVMLPAISLGLWHNFGHDDSLAGAVRRQGVAQVPAGQPGPEPAADAPGLCGHLLPRYSLLDRWVEDGLLDTLEAGGIGCIVYSPLAQGLLTDRYLGGAIPPDSRAGKPTGFLRPKHVTDESVRKARALNGIAIQRGQTLAQMALAWGLRRPVVTSALTGASRVRQIEDCVAALNRPDFTADELAAIEAALR